MMSSAPLVSIVIPCYNQGKYLARTIDSALAQTYSNVEVVVVNDGSTDDSAKVASHYPQSRYLAQGNRGVAEARNSGFNLSRGEFVQFIDADDCLTARAVESHLTCFGTHAEAGFVVGDIEWIDENGRCFGQGNWPVITGNFYEALLKVNHVANTIAVMFRRHVLETIGGFNGFFSPAEDYELLLRAARQFPSAHHSAVVAQYRRHLTNTSRKGAVMLKAMNRVVVAERPFVANSPRLAAALRKGDEHWRDFFGGVAIREALLQLKQRNVGFALASVGAILRYVRGRIFVIPWKYRRRGFGMIRRRLRRVGELLHHSNASTTSSMHGVFPPK